MVKTSFRIMVVVAAFFVLLNDAFAAPPPPKRPDKAPKKLAGKPPLKSYEYIKSHDVNGDGIVDTKDRILWIKRNRADLPAVLVSTENEDIYEVMDYDNDGSVSKAEIDAFYRIYDKNGDGILDEKEMALATD